MRPLEKVSNTEDLVYLLSTCDVSQYLLIIMQVKMRLLSFIMHTKIIFIVYTITNINRRIYLLYRQWHWDSLH